MGYIMGKNETNNNKKQEKGDLNNGENEIYDTFKN